MKKSPLWTNLLKQTNSLGKNKIDTDFTDRFVNAILEESKEGKLPLCWDVPFSYYKGKHYTINPQGIIKGLDGKEMKYIFYPNKLWPRVRIRRNRKKLGADKTQQEYYEVNVAKLMRNKFAPYIQGYEQSLSDPEKFIVVPKDSNRHNLSVQNLQFISKKLYQEKGSKREHIKKILTFNPQLLSRELKEQTGISLPYISKVKWEMRDEGLLDLRNLQLLREQTGIQITQENVSIYHLLLSSQGKISNSEVAKRLRWDAFTELKTNEEKRILTDKVVRIRKKLTDKGIIPRFNHSFEEKKQEAIEMLLDKPNSWLTNLNIATKLWLNKGQIDNLARQLKKK